MMHYISLTSIAAHLLLATTVPIIASCSGITQLINFQHHKLNELSVLYLTDGYCFFVNRTNPHHHLKARETSSMLAMLELCAEWNRQLRVHTNLRSRIRILSVGCPHRHSHYRRNLRLSDLRTNYRRPLRHIARTQAMCIKSI